MASARESPARHLGVVLPVLGGLMTAAAFPPLRLWPLIFVAWLPLWTLMRRELDDPSRRHPWRRVFFQGWLMGFVAFVGILHWILALSNEEVTIPGLMIPGLGLIGFYLGLFYGIGALLTRILTRWSGLPLLLIAPVIAALIEYLRSLGPLGFPWGAPGYALARVPALLQISATVGFWGLVLLVLLINAFLAAVIPVAPMRSQPRRAGGVLFALCGAALVAALWLYGAAILVRHPAGEIPAERHALRVLVAQPDIRREIKWKPEKKGLVIDQVLAHGTTAVTRNADFDLFIWPETVLPTRLLDDRAVLERVEAFVALADRPVLLGTQEGHWGTYLGEREWISYNSALVLYPDGARSAPYRKMRLVPFSERFPLQRIAPWLGSFDFGQSNFFPGDRFTRFAITGTEGEAMLGCLICFESAFPEIARNCVRSGATLLVNITNDFWFGRTAGPIQHAEMAIHRAVENRTPVVRCANTGVSFLVDPWGRVSHTTPLFTRVFFCGDVAVGSGSFASAHPDWMIGPLLGWVALTIYLGLRRRIRPPRPPVAREGEP